ncbi:hypothetical protein [Streptomyces sp. SID10815]|uniref:hypothetical protein n=1 Tax=Streptomyces sp. SID10815 TaxID=2706027 RepID=UPI0013C8A9BB|nr:hypothetical protein [Streptomyces sp. SID10815]NEA49243.1 hypothetical protein [Streptomyces sp. SID10815]
MIVHVKAVTATDRVSKLRRTLLSSAVPLAFKVLIGMGDSMVMELAHLAAQSSSPDWKLSLTVAAIPAFASIVAATVAARAAKRAKKVELSAQHLRDLENRISEKKYDVYKPMINLIRDMLDRRQVDEEDSRAKISDFSTWVIIYGSDEAVQAFHNFMQAAYHDPPVKVLMKLYADFVMAARRDMGYSDTKVEPSHFLGMRINDLYDNSLLRNIDVPYLDVCAEERWQPPWVRP